MYNLLELFRKYHYILLFLVLEAISFVLLFRFNRYQGHVWLSSANSVAAGINGVYSEACAYLNLTAVNRELTDANVRLQQENEQLREALADAVRDTTITERLMLERLAGFRLIGAKVVSNSRERANNYLVIDRGRQDGVEPEMGVVGGGGIVGIVYLAGDHHALVIPVTNKKSSISCRVRGQRYFGYLQWDGSSLRQAYVDDIPRYAHVRKGECVETSGYSSVFPPGIFVGRISRIANSPDGQSYKLTVDLGTNFANLRDVSVIATPYKAEIDTLRAHAAEADAALQP